MFKKLNLFVFISALLFSTSVFANHIHCDPELRSCLQAIQKVPEGKELVDSVKNQGAFGIVVTHSSLSQKFGAYWDPQQRLISLNPSAHSSQGELIGSLIFELHNALNSARFDHLDHLATTGQINKENYIATVEKLEFENSINAANIAKKGIQMGVLPNTSQLPTYKSFQEHFYYQKLAGHSAWVGHVYDQLAPRA